MTDNPFSAPATTVLAADDVFEGEVGSMSWPEVKKLRNASRSLRFLGALWVIGAVLVSVILVTGLINGFGMGLDLIFEAILGFALMLVVLSIYGVWARPAWGRIPGRIACVINLIQFPLGTAIGILGLIAFHQGARLFGPNKLTHRDLEARYRFLKTREKARKQRTQVG